jgi:hypothetical protein
MDVMVWVNTTMVHWLGRWGLLVAQRPHQVPTHPLLHSAEAKRKLRCEAWKAS